MVLVFGMVSVTAQTDSPNNSNPTIVKPTKITVEQARKIALKKIDGKIEDEYTIEEEDETIFAYVFIIRDANKKMFEIQVEAESGEVLITKEDTFEFDFFQ